MRKSIKYMLLVLMVLTACKRPDRGGPLFRILQDGKYGYINSEGHIVIAPIYFAAGDFSEGLAPVRQEGTYGYIDSTGQIVIPAQYDYADPFSDGVALVYRNDSSFYIDKTGKRLFHHAFAEMGPFINGRAIIETRSHKMGVINKQGELLIDTLYNMLTPTQYGHIIAYIYDSSYCGIIDNIGRIIVPFDKYHSIESPTDGYYPVRFSKGDESFRGFIDTTFQLKLFRKDSNYMYGIYGEIHDGLAPIIRCGSKIMSEYMDYVNLDGETILNDSTVDRTYPFSSKRAFIKYTDHSYGVVNTKGEKVSSQTFSTVKDEMFKNGIACVASNGFWGVIDTNAHFVVNPEFAELERMYISDDYFFFRNTRNEDQNAGIVDRHGQIVLRPILQQYDESGFVNGLLHCIIQGRLAYVNNAGYIVWRAPENTSLHDMNIDMMFRAHFRAYDSASERRYAPQDGNLPIAILPSDHFPKGKPSVIAATEKRDTVYQYYNGFKVFLVNDSDKPLTLGTTDNILEMKVQAFTQHKKWQDIEYVPRSWCGNSYYNITLMPHHYWKFECPVFDGAYKTKLRISLTFKRDKSSDDEITIYSNEFDGGINPGQLWREADYTPVNIMDPYFN